MEQLAFQELMVGNYCWGCGELNENGLGLKTYWDGDESAPAGFRGISAAWGRLTGLNPCQSSSTVVGQKNFPLDLENIVWPGEVKVVGGRYIYLWRRPGSTLCGFDITRWENDQAFIDIDAGHPVFALQYDESVKLVGVGPTGDAFFYYPAGSGFVKLKSTGF